MKYKPKSIAPVRLIFLLFVIGVLTVNAQYVDPVSKIYLPKVDDLKKHHSPEWFNDAKLGIFVHWGLYSVPAFAATKGSIREIMDNNRKEWFFYNAYAEWYQNTMRIKGSPTYMYHVENYGEDSDYYAFSQEFNKEIKNWSAEKMADVFKMSGAKYVILTSKHHDGYTLWPSRVNNNNVPEHCKPVSRDIVGELTSAVWGKGLKMGLYYSGGLDWTFNRTPITGVGRLWPENTPQSVEYATVADAHLRELIEKYKPSVLWNDIYYPEKGDLATILSDYYNLIPEGVINDRWGDFGVKDFTTPEYSEYNQIVAEKWESCRGLGYSFGYNQFEDDTHTLSSKALIQLLVDVVSKNGNLLINVGPKPDGTIPYIQVSRLEELGEWMQVNGEAIYETHPWKIYGGETLEKNKIRFTKKKDILYVHFFNPPKRKETISNLLLTEESCVQLIAEGKRLEWEQKGKDVEISFPKEVKGDYVSVIKITNVPVQMIE